MSPLSPLVSSSKPSVNSSPRRLVKPLRRAQDLDFERARRAAHRRGRKRRLQLQKLAIAIGTPIGLVALVLGARAISNYRSMWLGGLSLVAGIPSQVAPVAVGSSWFFASDEGAVWRAASKTAPPEKVWPGTFPAPAQIVGLSNGLVVAGGDGTLARLATSGKVRWSVKHAGSLFSRPAVLRSGANSLIVGADDAGRIWARDAANGKALWSQETSAPVGEGVTATPWGVVVPLLGNTTARGGLRCFSAQGGKVTWSFPSNARDRAPGTAIPRFDASTGRVFWCNDLGSVFALDARTGSKIWKSFVAPRAGARNTVMLRASPVLANGALVVGGNDGGLRAFDARDGHLLWTHWLSEPLSQPLGKARFNDQVVVVAGSKPVVMLDAKSGQVVRQLGTGKVGWNGREFAASDEMGTLHFWQS